jgi:hypothetical protein
MVSQFKFPNMTSLSVPCISYISCLIQFAKSWLHSNLSHNVLHMNVQQLYFSAEDSEKKISGEGSRQAFAKSTLDVTQNS